jgi:hypothetical protein
MTRAEAKALAEAKLRRDGGGVVIVDDLTQEHDFGWVFFVNSPVWARSRDVRDAIPGAGAILVDREDRSVHVGGGQPPDRFIASYRARGSRR